MGVRYSHAVHLASIHSCRRQEEVCRATWKPVRTEPAPVSWHCVRSLRAAGGDQLPEPGGRRVLPCLWLVALGVLRSDRTLPQLRGGAVAGPGGGARGTHHSWIDLRRNRDCHQGDGRQVRAIPRQSSHTIPVSGDGPAVEELRRWGEQPGAEPGLQLHPGRPLHRHPAGHQYGYREARHLRPSRVHRGGPGGQLQRRRPRGDGPAHDALHRLLHSGDGPVVLGLRRRGEQPRAEPGPHLQPRRGPAAYVFRYRNNHHGLEPGLYLPQGWLFRCSPAAGRHHHRPGCIPPATLSGNVPTCQPSTRNFQLSIP